MLPTALFPVLEINFYFPRGACEGYFIWKAWNIFPIYFWNVWKLKMGGFITAANFIKIIFNYSAYHIFHKLWIEFLSSYSLYAQSVVYIVQQVIRLSNI